VDWTVVIPHGVDPVVGLWKDRSGREGGAPPVSPHQILQLPELVLQLELSLGQGLHNGGIIGPDMGDGAGVQIVRAFKRAHEVSPKPGL